MKYVIYLLIAAFATAAHADPFVPGQVLTANGLNAALATKAEASDLSSPVAGKGAALVGYKRDSASASASTVQNKLQEIVSVKDFGAGAGGDDLAKFNAAAVAAGTNGQVAIPAGTYSLSATTTGITWLVDANATFTGAGGLGGRIVKLGNGGVFGHASKIGSPTAWLEAERVSTENNADLVVLSSIGQGGIIGGSRTSDFNAAGSMGAIGLAGWALNNNATEVQSAYAGYYEARRKSGAGTTHGVEIDIVNQDATTVINHPYQMGATGSSLNLWLASGGEIAATPASLALGIINNGSSFEKGIVFGSTSILGTDGVTGTGTAIGFAKGHALQWYGAGGAGIGYINNTVATAANRTNLNFSDSGAAITGDENQLLTLTPNVANAANFGVITAGTAGNAVTYGAAGSDSNVDLNLSPKGNGAVRITDHPTVILNRRTTPTVAGEAPGLKVGIASGEEAGWVLNPAAGDYVTMYPYVSTSPERTRVWAMNAIVDVTAGNPGSAWAIEGNVNVATGNSPDPRNVGHALGIDMVSGGDHAPSSAFSTFSNTLANRWKHGLWFDNIGGQAGSTLIKANSNVSVDYGLDLAGATVNYMGVRVGQPTAGVAANIGARQTANGQTSLFLQRFTDTAPTGNLLQVTNAANNAVLASIDANGAVSGSQLTSTVATGTAPLVVSSTTPVANLSIGGTAANASQLLGATWAAPGAIGSTAASSGAFTDLTASSAIVAAGTTSLNGNISGVALPGNDSTTGAVIIGWNRSSGGGETSFINAKGAGGSGGFHWYTWNGTTSTLIAALDSSGNFGTSGSILSAGPTSGVGYKTGAGGAVTQLTSKVTGVTLNTPTGQITMSGAALAAAATACFTLTNSTIAATDVVNTNIASGATSGAYTLQVEAVAAGSARICLNNRSAGSLSEAIVVNYAVIKGSAN